MKRIFALLWIGVLLLFAGCESIDWENLGKPKEASYVITIHSVLHNPRGDLMLERRISRFDGSTVWINDNQNLSSKHIREIRLQEVEGQPEMRRLVCRLNNAGLRLWEHIRLAHMTDWVVLIDDIHEADFTTGTDSRIHSALDPKEEEWVVMPWITNRSTAEKLQAKAKDNYDYFNPNEKKSPG